MKIEDLKKICQEEKLKTNKGLVLLNRNVSIRVTSLFINFNIQPTSATTAGIISGIAGSLLFIFDQWWCNIAGILLLYVSFLFDQVDGELARYYRKVSLSGVYLDEIRHLVIYGLTIFCLSFPAALGLHSRLPYLMGFIGALALIVSRVEERLPKLIFTEKIILKENFTGGEVCDVAYDVKEGAAGPEKKNIIIKALSRLVYRTADILSHQVNILLWLLAVTIVDHFILRGARILEVFTAQTFVFILFTSVCPVAALGAIIGNYRAKRVEEECRRINAELRK
jgi:hypothetical protein